jgi:hypothetical protein
LMIIPRRHILNEDCREITPDEWMQILDVWKWAQDFYKIPGGGFVGRFGEFKYNAGTIRHLHFQLQVPDGMGNVKATFFKDRSPIEEARRANRKARFKETVFGFVIWNSYGHFLDDKFRWVKDARDPDPFVHALNAIPHILKIFEGKNVIAPISMAKAIFTKEIGLTRMETPPYLIEPDNYK